jgi:hypothetical protein
MLPSLKYVRGEMFSDKHWLEMFGILGIPSKSVEILTFGDFLNAKENIAANANALQVSMCRVIEKSHKSCHQFACRTKDSLQNMYTNTYV